MPKGNALVHKIIFISIFARAQIDREHALGEMIILVLSRPVRVNLRGFYKCPIFLVTQSKSISNRLDGII